MDIYPNTSHHFPYHRTFTKPLPHQKIHTPPPRAQNSTALMWVGWFWNIWNIFSLKCFAILSDFWHFLLLLTFLHHEALFYSSVKYITFWLAPLICSQTNPHAASDKFRFRAPEKSTCNLSQIHGWHWIFIVPWDWPRRKSRRKRSASTINLCWI